MNNLIIVVFSSSEIPSFYPEADTTERVCYVLPYVHLI